MKIDNVRVQYTGNITGKNLVDYFPVYRLVRAGYNFNLNRRDSIIWIRNFFVDFMKSRFISAYIEFVDGSTAHITPKGFTCQLTCNFE